MIYEKHPPFACIYIYEKFRVYSRKFRVNSRKWRINSRKWRVNSKKFRVNLRNFCVISRKLRVYSRKFHVNSRKIKKNSLRKWAQYRLSYLPHRLMSHEEYPQRDVIMSELGTCVLLNVAIKICSNQFKSVEQRRSVWTDLGC